MQKMTWQEICEDDGLRGRWVAVDGSLFDAATGSAVSAAVVDADDDLAELCVRIREAKFKNCLILLAERDGCLPATAANRTN